MTGTISEAAQEVIDLWGMQQITDETGHAYEVMSRLRDALAASTIPEVSAVRGDAAQGQELEQSVQHLEKIAFNGESADRDGACNVGHGELYDAIVELRRLQAIAKASAAPGEAGESDAIFLARMDEAGGHLTGDLRWRDVERLVRMCRATQPPQSENARVTELLTRVERAYENRRAPQAIKLGYVPEWLRGAREFAAVLRTALAKEQRS